MPFAPTDDECEIYYEEHGSNGPVLVFVSGYFGITDIWREVISSLSTRYQCICYENRGFGRSSKPMVEGMYSIERHAADLQSVLLAARVLEKEQPIILVTHSMGCNIATSFCVQHKEKIRGVAYLGPHRDGKWLREQGFTMQMLVETAEVPSKCVEFYAGMGLRPEIALEAAKWPSYARRYNAKAMLDFAIEETHLEMIQIPSIIIMGENEGSGNGEQLAHKLAKDFKKCEIAMLKDVNHFPSTEAPGEVSRIIDQFVVASLSDI
ncbi:hypothetical protein AtubIFM57143_002573 [Aspergillus tubingensis]|nr:hypothetical protein AtubIFM57143_002573 [Aspergillus tubingensis]